MYGSNQIDKSRRLQKFGAIYNLHGSYTTPQNNNLTRNRSKSRDRRWYESRFSEEDKTSNEGSRTIKSILKQQRPSVRFSNDTTSTSNCNSYADHHEASNSGHISRRDGATYDRCRSISRNGRQVIGSLSRERNNIIPSRNVDTDHENWRNNKDNHKPNKFNRGMNFQSRSNQAEHQDDSNSNSNNHSLKLFGTYGRSRSKSGNRFGSRVYSSSTINCLGGEEQDSTNWRARNEVLNTAPSSPLQDDSNKKRPTLRVANFKNISKITPTVKLQNNHCNTGSCGHKLERFNSNMSKGYNDCQEMIKPNNGKQEIIEHDDKPWTYLESLKHRIAKQKEALEDKKSLESQKQHQQTKWINETVKFTVKSLEKQNNCDEPNKAKEGQIETENQVNFRKFFLNKSTPNELQNEDNNLKTIDRIKRDTHRPNDNIQSSASARQLSDSTRTLVDYQGIDHKVESTKIIRILAGEDNFTASLIKLNTTYGLPPNKVKEFEQANQHVVKLSSGCLELKPRLQLCKNHNSANGCSRKYCHNLHICFIHVMNSCSDDEDCEWGHRWTTPHNKRILNKFNLDILSSTKLKHLFEDFAESMLENYTIKICHNYISRRCYYDTNCMHLHICIAALAGMCNKDYCDLNHSLLEPRVRLQLKRAGVVNTSTTETLLALFHKYPNIVNQLENYELKNRFK